MVQTFDSVCIIYLVYHVLSENAFAIILSTVCECRLQCYTSGVYSDLGNHPIAWIRYVHLSRQL